MASKKAKETWNQAKRQPLNYLYTWCSDAFIKTLQSDKAAIIRRKRANQEKTLNVIAIDNDLTFAKAQETLAAIIKEKYNLTPKQILGKLADGENVVGKNWNKGIYGISGIGSAKQTYFSQNTNIYTDTKTGKLYNGSEEIANQQPIYKTGSNGTYIAGYEAVLDGKSYTSSVDYQNMGFDGSNLSYYANTYGATTENGDGVQQYANGVAYDTSDSSSTWEAIATYIPMIMQFFSWIMSLIQSRGLVAMTKANTTPSQDEWVEESPNKSALSSIALIGLLGAGAYFILKDK